MIQLEIYDFLSKNGYKHKERAGELYLSYCPYCETSDKGNYSHLSFRADNGLFRCKKCDKSGNLYLFALDQGHIISKAVSKNYYRPTEKPEYITEIDKFYKWYN